MTQTLEPTTSQQDDLFAFNDCELVNISDAMTLVINRQNGRQQIMAPQVVEGLQTCTEFKTLQEHAAHLASTRPELGGQQAAAAAVLGDLRDAHMLVKAGDTCTRLAQSAQRQVPPTRAFIISADRPDAVQRLLDSMLRSAKLTMHDALFLVDDSRDAGNRKANQEAVARFNTASAKEMFYLGKDAQDELLHGLTAALPGHADGIQFLLDPGRWVGKKTYGRSRTLCLLLSVGYRALLMDDDILCQAVNPPISEPGIFIGSSGVRKAAFFPDREALMESGEIAGFDPLAGHASLLGSTLSEALHSLNGGPLQTPQLENVPAALADVLQADSPVLVTQCGTLGDPGTQSRHWVMYQTEDSVQRLLSAPQGMSAAIDNRMSWLGCSQPNIIKMPVMSQLTGLDNSRLLPPYFPAYRGEDLLFGAMIAALHTNCVALEYPWSVPHLPLEQRPPNQSPVAATGGMSLLVRFLSNRIDFRVAAEPEQNLAQLSREALRLAARPDALLMLDFRAELAATHVDQLRLLQSQFARTQQLGSAEWQDYLRGGIEELQLALAQVQGLTGIDQDRLQASETELLAEFRQMAQGFGAALAGWAEVREVAAPLAEEMISSGNLLPS